MEQERDNLLEMCKKFTNDENIYKVEMSEDRIVTAIGNNNRLIDFDYLTYRISKNHYFQ